MKSTAERIQIPLEQERFSRHLNLKEIGIKGQKRLFDGKVLIIGMGGLGSPAALSLAAAGVGTLGLVDNDVVDISNLQRQIIFGNNDLGLPKVEIASRELKLRSSQITIHQHQCYFNEDNAADLLAGYDFVIDATDNFSSKFLINDQCIMANIPFCHGGILAFSGQAMTISPHKSACYRCIFEMPPKIDSKQKPQGPLGTLPGIIGIIQATEALKYLLSQGNLLNNRLLTYDALAMTFRTINLKQNRNCQICGDEKHEY